MSLKILTPKEEMHLMKELRSRVNGLLNEEMFEDDNLFQRFLRARNYNMDAAEEMLKNHIKWRKQHNVDTILKDYTPPEVAGFLPLQRLGYDKEGFPVVYFQFGNTDWKGYSKCLTKNECDRYMIYWFEGEVEEMKKESAKTGKDISQWLYIYDFANFSITNVTHKQTIEVLTSFASLYESNYPERLKTAYFINASFVFTLLFSMLKPLASGHTIQKMRIFGKEVWKEELLKEIDADVLPASLGGNRTDPDGNPRWRSFIKSGGPIPEQFYAIRNINSMSQRAGTKTIEVSRKSKSEVEVEIPYPGSKLEWEFQTKNKDIGFTLLYKQTRNLNCPVNELLPKKRFETDQSAECGMYHCVKSGIYILEFDNSYSWTYNKVVYYKMSVVSPQNHLSSDLH